MTVTRRMLFATAAGAMLPRLLRPADQMTGWGAPLKPQDREAILDYLSNQFK